MTNLEKLFKCNVSFEILKIFKDEKILCVLKNIKYKEVNLFVIPPPWINKVEFDSEEEVVNYILSMHFEYISRNLEICIKRSEHNFSQSTEDLIKEINMRNEEIRKYVKQLYILCP